MINNGVYMCDSQFIRGVNLKFQQKAYLFIIASNLADWNYSQVKQGQGRLNRFMGDVKSEQCTVFIHSSIKKTDEFINTLKTIENCREIQGPKLIVIAAVKLIQDGSFDHADEGHKKLLRDAFSQPDKWQTTV